MKTHSRSSAVLAAVACLLCLAPSSLHAATKARDILTKTGVAGGLIVHLGCGDGSFTADLLAGPSYRVHGLEADGAKVDAARAFLEKEGVYG